MSFLHKAVATTLRAGRAALDVLYPPTCLACGGRTASPQDPLCLTCLRGIERPETDMIAEALTRLPGEAQQAFESAFSLWLFDAGGAVQQVLHALKYNNRPRYGVMLGQLIGTGLQEAHPDLAPDLILPIPLHKTRELERGYNQAAVLGQGIAETAGVVCREDVLVRRRATTSQTGLSREERWTNVRNVFAVRDEDALAGAEVLLVDDVLTTGSTSASAAMSLLKGGAEAVHLATLAYARG